MKRTEFNKEMMDIKIEANTCAAIRGIKQAHDETIYITGFLDGAEYKRQRIRGKEMLERKRYFIKQKLFGVIVLIIAALSVKALDGDMTAALIMVPLGLVLITSSKMLIVNKYYWKHEDKKGL